MQLGNKKLILNTKNLYKELSPEYIYKFMLPDVKFDKTFNSPLRKDNNPSFIIYKDKFMFYDFATATAGDAITFTSLFYKLSFRDSLIFIVCVFNLESKFLLEKTIEITPEIKSNAQLLVSTLKTKNFKQKEEKSLKVKIRPYNKKDLEYWKKYRISKDLLPLANIYAISHYSINNYVFTADELAFVFVENKDEHTTLKIYQPYNTKYKWISDNSSDVWELWNFKNITSSKHLVICSSRKDALCFYKFGSMYFKTHKYSRSDESITVKALQSELIKPKQKVINQLKEKHEHIYVLFDFDHVGLQASENLAKEFDLIDLTNKVNNNLAWKKDFSDTFSVSNMPNSTHAKNNFKKIFSPHFS